MANYIKQMKDYLNISVDLKKLQIINFSHTQMRFSSSQLYAIFNICALAVLLFEMICARPTLCFKEKVHSVSFGRDEWFAWLMWQTSTCVAWRQTSAHNRYKCCIFPRRMIGAWVSKYCMIVLIVSTGWLQVSITTKEILQCVERAFVSV